MICRMGCEGGEGMGEDGYVEGMGWVRDRCAKRLGVCCIV